MAETQVGWTFLRSKRWIGYFSLLVIFSIACVFLGNWQFDRRDQARAEIARIDRNYDAAPVELAEAVPDPTHFDEGADKWLTVTLRGSYAGDPVLARNRPGPGGVGANIIAPFETTDGRIFFIDRGWVPASTNELDAVLEALPEAPSGEVEIVARLRAGEPDIAGRSASGQSIASINPAAAAEVTGVKGEVYTAVYGMLVSESPSGDHGELPPKPERDEGPHLSYALQWYVFIIIAGIGVAYAARQEYRGLNAGSEQVRAQDAKQAARKKRRGMSDADEEDALIDA